MNIFVMNDNFETISIIDSYESVIWTDRYIGYGDFEIYAPFSFDLLNKVKQDYYLTIVNSEHVMIIESVEILSDTDKLKTIMGSGITAGDEITISTIKGNKYISLLRAGKTYNILNIMDKNADWFQLAKGDNIFTYTAVYGASNLQFSIINQVAFEGV